MTTLVGWLGVHSQAPSSIYLASDSRISWEGPGRHWDAARKLFACRHSADLFGYCGDAFFPSQILGQVADMADHHLLFRKTATSSDRHERLVEAVAGSLAQREGPVEPDFTLVHSARDFTDRKCSFKMWLTIFSKGAVSKDSLIHEIDASQSGPSRRLVALGTGAAAYVQEAIRWSASDQGGTSRGFFTALCDVLDRQEDAGSGGVPQLVGLYRVGNGRSFGVVHGGKRYLHGLAVGTLDDYGSIEWRDDAFQRIDPRSLELRRRAQRQVRPRLKG